MSQRKVSAYFFSSSSRIFSSLDEAIAAVNAAMEWFRRYAKNHPDNAFFITATVSENDGHYGEMCAPKTGKRGRPRRQFNSNCPEAKTGVHVHVAFIGFPGETIRKDFVEYFNKKCARRGLADRKNINFSPCKDIESTLVYILKQSKHMRHYSYNPNNIIDEHNDLGLSEALKKVKSVHKINAAKFYKKTKLPVAKHPSAINPLVWGSRITSMFSPAAQPKKSLLPRETHALNAPQDNSQCNNNITISCMKSISVLLCLSATTFRLLIPP